MSSLHEMVFTLVAEGRLSAADARKLLDVPPAVTDPNRPIAVIGMAGQFGDCLDLDAYWEMMAAGRHCIRPLPSGRWFGQDGVGGFLEDPSLFDPLFFKIAPTEAGLMDPQQRLFLEAAYLALEDANQTEQALAGSACSVFVGTGAGDYGQRLEAAGIAELPQALMGNVPSILAARIAYLLDIKGPALAIDTACSSSLVAVHLACESLRRDECELAVAGGVCVINSARFVNAMSKAGVISASGRCHTFDSRADGFVCGEGSGAVVLKLLDKAQADGDMIHAVILGSGINQDGRTNGITAPSAPSQEALERSVYQRFGIDPAAIGYIETHGTGTPLGDPIEIEALSRVFGVRKDPKVLLGSVKTNIGHALTAAGIAGLLKVLLMLRAARIPPAVDFQQENPRLGLDDTAFRVATESQTWHPGPAGRRIAAVSSFGFSGTNAHLLVAQAPSIKRRAPQRQPVALLLSGRDRPALARRAADLAAQLRRWPELRLDDVALTLATGRTPMAQRAALVAQDRDEALLGLDRLARGEVLPAPQAAGQVMVDLALTWLAGEIPDAKKAFARLESRRVSLPGYPLNRYPCHPISVAATTNYASTDDPLESVRRAKLYSNPDPDLTDNGIAFAQIEHWGCKAAAVALMAAGLFAKGRKVMTRAALRRDFGVIEQCWGLFDALLPILERVGVIVVEGDLLRIQPSQTDLSTTELQAEEQRLSAEQPSMRPFVEMLKRTTAALPEVLRGQVQGNAILFPEGRLDLVAAIYGGNQLADHFNTLMAQTLVALVRHRLKTVSRVQILEIGAGTGGATAAILQALKPFAGQIHYTYTDVSLGFLKHGRESFGERP